MNKENIKKWVDALRSGEYIQCQNALHKNDNGVHSLENPSLNWNTWHNGRK